MLRKAYTPLSMLLEALTLLVIGISFLSNPEGTLIFVIGLIHLLVWVAAINHLFRWLTKRNEKRPSLAHALLLAAFAFFLHLGSNVVFGFGHVDIALDHKVYSFGPYDAASNRLFGIYSDGVFLRRTGTAICSSQKNTKNNG